LSDTKRIVAAGYDRIAARYAALEAERSAWPRLRRLEPILAELPPGSPVLDVGCGDGIPALAAIAERHVATGIDISATQSKRASQNVPAARVLNGDIAAQDFRANTFAAIVAFYVLEHLPREEHGPLLGRFARWLRPGGHLLLTTESGDEPGTVGEWLDVPMYFSQFDEKRTTELLEAAGFDAIVHEVEAQLEGDREVEYVWFHARRR
jgi:cyclopropane fatty-acyl-phospholipid synthase-like methyltransferase